VIALILWVSTSYYERTLNYLIIGAFATMILALLLMRIEMRIATPPTLRIALIGYSRTGKTVFTTVLLSTLKTTSNHTKRIKTRGKETREKLGEDYKELESGNWLQNPTPEENPFTYCVDINRPRSIYVARSLEITDYGGPIYPNPLHNHYHMSPFYSDILRSHVFLLAIDLDNVIKMWNENAFVPEIKKSLNTFLEEVFEHKKLPRNKRMGIPIAIVFLKSDLLINPNTNVEKDGRLLYGLELENEILRKFDETIRSCKNHTMHFKCFFVSSTGRVDIENANGRIEADSVTEPLKWVMDVLR